jgi:hypothetical protein
MPIGASRTINYSATEELTGTPFDRGVTVTAVVDDYNTARFQVGSNLPNTAMKYLITGVANSDFTSGNISSEFTTDSSGDFQLTLQLNETTNYSASTVEFFANVSSVHDTTLAQSSNIIIKPSPAMVATGGTVTEVDEWRIHTFTSNADFVVTETSIGTAYIQIAGGGGSGGPGQRTQNLIFGGNRYERYSGSGGGGGVVYESSRTTQGIPINTYPAVIGQGGTANAGAGAGGTGTTFLGYSANGGGPGGGYEQDPGTGFATGGGGNSTYSSWTDNTPVWNQQLFPSNPSVGTQFYYAYNGGDQLFVWNGSSWTGTIDAYVSNEAGVRPDNEGASGTLFDGGNAIVVAADPTTDDAQKPYFLKYDTVGGGGASSIDDGNPNLTADINASNSLRSGFAGGAGGTGTVSWDNKPLPLDGRTTREYGPGGDGGETTNDIFGTPSVGSEPGAGGQGANAGNDTTITSIALTNFTGADGAPGIAKIAYEYRKRAFAT